MHLAILIRELCVALLVERIALLVFVLVIRNL